MGRLVNCSRRYAGTLAIFMGPQLGHFNGTLLGRTSGDKFIGHTSGGEIAFTSYAWSDKQVSQN